MEKDFGVFYTPQYMVDFSVQQLISRCSQEDIRTVLEPSAGDGRFVEKLYSILGERAFRTDMIEINKESCNNLEAKFITRSDHVKVDNSDFLFSELNNDYYDLIIGNPPYISKKRLGNTQLAKFREILDEHEIPHSADKNLWAAFILKCEKALKQDGIMSFILPFELLQVKFAESIQVFLEKNFERLEIYTFQQLLFDSAGQDTVLLMAYKRHSERGLFIFDVDSTSSNDLNNLIPKELCRKNTIEQNGTKWSSLVLSDSDLSFLNGLYLKLPKLNQYIDSKPGIVTAANDFFIINEQQANKYALDAFTRPIVQKSSFIGNSVQFSKRDYEKLKKLGKPSLFLDLHSYNEGSSSEVDKYLEIGLNDSIDQRYKCKKRTDWFKVPIVPPGAGFFFKRCHEYPRFVKNTAKVFTTDTAYNVYPKKGIKIADIVYSFYNPLTLCFAELLGRHYGGGVLELTPTEFKKLPMPLVEVERRYFDKFVRTIGKKKNIQEVLELFGRDILHRAINISDTDLDRLMRIYSTLVRRRFGKSGKSMTTDKT
ncbi:MAG: SAM-dependent methyltransferase [Alteromonadaceae bacterium]|nr:SAM-dependent methyltransferase [Alteromonadaceae bacterium]MAX43607.1 SAM-dependent methyltransferase [Alteromonadaceae bacterium]|tara:strand:- start:447 stop:2066 length:1620 start_codon:yes stop_codon:yes gene_type:complete